MKTALLFSAILAICNIAAATAPGTTGPLTLNNRENLVFSGLNISGAPENCILLSGCKNILLENCDVGPSIGEGVHLIGCTSVTITNCRMSHIRTGVYAVNCSGIRVTSCTFLNVQGPMPHGQFVQFDKVTGAGNCIASNRGENQPGKSNPEDAISIYMSSGTSEDPLIVEGNTIIGGGPSQSGGGIMTGDNGSAQIIVQRNRLIDPGQYGIAIAGGNGIQLLENIIYAKSQPFTNVGVYVWNQSKGSCGGHTVRGNRVCWYNKEGQKAGAWNAGNCGVVDGWESNDWNAHFSTEDIVKDLPKSNP